MLHTSSQTARKSSQPLGTFSGLELKMQIKPHGPRFNNCGDWQRAFAELEHTHTRVYGTTRKWNNLVGQRERGRLDGVES